MKRITFSLVSALAFAVVLTSSAAAQTIYNSNIYTRNQVDSTIKRAEDSSDKFRTDFRNQMKNNHGLSNSQKDQYNSYVAACEDALDRLRSRFNSDNTWFNARNQVQDVINASQNVNTMMNSLPFRRNLESQWNNLRNDINTLANTYGLPGLNGGGWTGTPWNPGNPGYPGNGGYPGNPGAWNPGWQTSKPPSWAVGTFYSTNSSESIQLTIQNDGRISVINNGQSYWGRFYNNRIYLNNDVSTIARSGNGIRTYNQSNGATTIYSRNGYGNGPGYPGYPGNPGWGGSTSTPPSWAVGRFRSTGYPRIDLTIESSGRVTVVNGGQTYYGTYYNGTMTLNGDTSTISQSGNGIVTYNQSNGQSTTYRRR